MDRQTKRQLTMYIRVACEAISHNLNHLIEDSFLNNINQSPDIENCD